MTELNSCGQLTMGKSIGPINFDETTQWIALLHVVIIMTHIQYTHFVVIIIWRHLTVSKWTRLPSTKWPPFHRRYFQMHFCDKVVNMIIFSFSETTLMLWQIVTIMNCYMAHGKMISVIIKQQKTFSFKTVLPDITKPLPEPKLSYCQFDWEKLQGILNQNTVTCFQENTIKILSAKCQPFRSGFIGTLNTIQ